MQVVSVGIFLMYLGAERPLSNGVSCSSPSINVVTHTVL
jgi:hypothetical protein